MLVESDTFFSEAWYIFSTCSKSLNVCWLYWSMQENKIFFTHEIFTRYFWNKKVPNDGTLFCVHKFVCVQLTLPYLGTPVIDLYFTSDLDGFTVEHSRELPEETSYSVLLSFSHDVLIERVGVSPSGNRANCNANNQTSKQVILSCSDLSNSTTYSVTVQGKASLNNSESGYQYSQFAVSLDFSTAARMNNETVERNG